MASSQAGAAPLTFKPIADARVQQAFPHTNFGSTMTLWTGQGTSSSMLTFNVQGLGGNKAAKLRLYVKDASVNKTKVQNSISCYEESNLTWDTMPNLSTSQITFTPGKVNSWVEVDVGTVFGDGTITYALTGVGSDIAKFASREDPSFAPQLVFPSVTDTRLPVTQLVQPAAGSTVKGTVDLLATASDNTTIDKVEFWRDGTKIGNGTPTSEGYTLPWNTTTVANGSYQLKARAFDPTGNMTVSKYSVNVSNTGLSLLPVASFNHTQNGSVAPVKASFTDTSTNSPTRWLWSFGDGQTSVKQNPTDHIFANPGTYNVSLTSTNSLGSSTTSQTIQVDPFNRPNRPAGQTRILLAGDSLTGQYCMIAMTLLHNEGYSVNTMADNGIGLLSATPDQVAKLQSYITNYDPDKVVIEDIGNYFQDNTIDPSVQPDSPEFLALWQQRADQASQIAQSRGAKVWWMDSPPIFLMAPQGPSSDEIRAIYHTLHQNNPALNYLDAYYPFGGPNLNFSLRTDGVHLNSAGQLIMGVLVHDSLAPTGPDTTAPTVPVLSSAIINSNQVKLDWTRSVDSGPTGLVGYKITRSDGQIIADSTDPAVLSFTDTTVAQGSTYSYTVAGFDAAGNQSGPSNQVTIAVPDTTAPSTPELTGSLNPDNTVGLSWATVTDTGGSGLAGYKLYRNDDPTPYATISDPTATTYTDTAVGPGLTYSYRLVAFDGAGNSSPQSNQISITTNP